MTPFQLKVEERLGEGERGEEDAAKGREMRQEKRRRRKGEGEDNRG